MGMGIVQAIRRRSRQEWLDHWKNNCNEIRRWIQDHPEQAAALSLILGMFIVLFFRLFFTLLAIFILVLFAVWAIALESDNQKSSNGNGSPSAV